MGQQMPTSQHMRPAEQPIEAVLQLPDMHVPNAQVAMFSHPLPSVVRVHEPFSVAIELPHVPPPQVKSVRCRFRDPVSSQVLVKPKQVLQDPKVLEPQVVPSVVRVQLPFSVDIWSVQMADTQVGIVTVRDRVPVSSHTFEKLPQLPHGPWVVVPHELPLVLRLQPPMSGLV